MRSGSLFCLVGLIVCSVQVMAQQTEIEVMAGPATTSLDYSTGNDLRKMKIVPMAAIGVNRQITNHWSATAQLRYERKGNKSEGTGYDENAQFTYNYEIITNMDYITLPVMARYTIGGKVQIYGEAGGFISYLLKSQQHIIVNEIGRRYENKTKTTNDYNTIDAGVCLSAGLAIPITNQLKLKAVLSENLGLANINDFKNPITGKTDKVTTNYLSLQLGISFMMK